MRRTLLFVSLCLCLFVCVHTMEPVPPVRTPQPRRVRQLRGLPTPSASPAPAQPAAAPSPTTAAKEGESMRMAGEGGTGVDLIPFCHDDRYRALRLKNEAEHARAVERRRSNAGLDDEREGSSAPK
jgi:hypothetical protein